MKTSNTSLRIALGQINPVWMNRSATLERVCEQIAMAGDASCRLCVFGEALVPGYPFWLSLCDGARFESPLQKDWHQLYLREAVDIQGGDLDSVCQAAKNNATAVYLGTVERAMDRGGHSLYCTLVYISPQGTIGSVHRKLMPTYEERLCWAVGDGAGLVAHPLDGFMLGGLNCWENWMPLTRAAFYAQGVNVHVAVWPGSHRNTADITRFIARESRSFVLSVSGLLHRDTIDAHLPEAQQLIQAAPPWLADGGSAIASPDGSWLVEPLVGCEKLIVADLDLAKVHEERQNFDPSGHYARADVTALRIDRRRQSIAQFIDE